MLKANTGKEQFFMFFFRKLNKKYMLTNPNSIVIEI